LLFCVDSCCLMSFSQFCVGTYWSHLRASKKDKIGNHLSCEILPEEVFSNLRLVKPNPDIKGTIVA